MGRIPAALFPLVTAGLALLPGCVVIPSEPAGPPAKPAAAARPAPAEKFATHRNITRPGEVVRLNEPAAAPPAPVPDPPTVTAGAVQPPVPAVQVALSPPPPPDPPLVAAVRAYLDNRPDLAVEHLRGLDKTNQELLIRLLPAVAHAQHADRRDAADLAVLATKVEAAADAVARVAPLQVGKACFVSSVKQYGVYDPLPVGYAFLPGGMVQLYAEVQNAPSDPTPHPGGGDGYVTRLTCELRLFDAAGKLLAKFDPANVPDMAVNDFTRSQLRDVFLRLQFQVPRAAGAYTAEFAVRDPATGRAARKAVEFRVAGP